MPTLTKLERQIRETHENNVACGIRLHASIERAVQARDRIVADGRLTRDSLPDVLELLSLLPTIRADSIQCLRYMRQLCGMYCQLVRQRRESHQPRFLELEDAA